MKRKLKPQHTIFLPLGNVPSWLKGHEVAECGLLRMEFVMKFLRHFLLGVIVFAGCADSTEPILKELKQPEIATVPDEATTQSEVAYNKSPSNLFKVDCGRFTRPVVRPSPEDITQIESLISQFKNLESPIGGISDSCSSGIFAPLNAKEFAGPSLVDGTKISTFLPLEQVVRYGSAAIPPLLASLGSTVETNLQFSHDDFFGAMTLVKKMPDMNPVGAEASALTDFLELSDTEISITSHHVTVADVCFVALGQIVGRNYQAVWYQPSGCVFVTSPSRDPELRDILIKVWSSKNSNAKLFDSLINDYSTRGRFNGVNLGEWDIGSEFQVRAIRRLLFYYPTVGVPLTTSRLRSLDVAKPKTIFPDYVNLQVKNGVISTDFINAVKWTSYPQVLEALETIRKSTDDPEIINVLAAR